VALGARMTGGRVPAGRPSLVFSDELPNVQQAVVEESSAVRGRASAFTTSCHRPAQARNA